MERGSVVEPVVYEVAVLGAGVEGSATAYYLASRGTRPVLLLEQVWYNDTAAIQQSTHVMSLPVRCCACSRQFSWRLTHHAESLRESLLREDDERSL